MVQISVKPKGGIPGDVTGEQMRALADLADTYSQGELRITHRQNVVFPYVKATDLLALYQGLAAVGLGEDNIGEASDIIACPGLDYCALATARSIRDAGCRDVLHLEGSASHCFTLKLYPAKRAEALAKWVGYFASG